MKQPSFKIVQNTSCFNEHVKRNLCCKKTECKYWILHRDSQNCTIIGASHGPKTLQEIGDIFGLTRMRICQIEKTVLKKLESETIVKKLGQ